MDSFTISNLTDGPESIRILMRRPLRDGRSGRFHCISKDFTNLVGSYVKCRSTSFS